MLRKRLLAVWVVLSLLGDGVFVSHQPTLAGKVSSVFLCVFCGAVIWAIVIANTREKDR